MNLFECNDLKEKKLYWKTFIYSLISGILLIIIILLLNYLKKDIYYQNDLVFDNNVAITYVLKEDLKHLVNNHKMIMNNKEYLYKIDEVELINDINSGYLAKIKIYDANCFEDDINFKYKVLVKKETLFNYLFRIIGGKNE